MQWYMVNNKDLRLDEEDKRHIINVMRMNIGECFNIVYDKILYTCKITHITKKDILYEVIDSKELNNRKDYKIVLAISLIKEQKMDYLLQKATELGVDEIIPIISERTIVKVDSKKNRWNRILKEASEQSHRCEMPIMHEIIKLKDITKYKSSLNIFCNTMEMSKNIKKVLQDNKKSDTILIAIGPEGGFSEREIEFLINNGFISVTLGDNILRAETVPLFLLSIINYQYMR